MPAAERHELFALVRRHPRCCLPRVRGLSGGQVGGQAHESPVPAHADRAGTELVPLVVVHVSGVLQLEPGPTLGFARQPGLDPADASAVLPGGGEAVRRVAPLDLPARVALICWVTSIMEFSSGLVLGQGRRDRRDRDGGHVASGEFGRQRRQVRSPEAPESVEPCVDVAQRLGLQRVSHGR